MKLSESLQFAENGNYPINGDKLSAPNLYLAAPYDTKLSEREHEIKRIIMEETGEKVYRFIKDNVNLEDAVFLTVTSTPFNKDKLRRFSCDHIINLKKINDVAPLNKFFQSVNARLPVGGLYINSVETFSTRKKRLLKRIPKPFNWLYYPVDVLFTRIFPKLKFTKGPYFFITRGKGRVLSRAETLGRLYFCGFEVVEERHINEQLYFVARKVKETVIDKSPHYGPIIKLRRVGKDGKLFNVYKLRTMHAYSEYLQQYVFERNSLQEGGKFKDDFRISPEGKFFRKFWLDELPMVINLLKGDMKLVGVRPLSNQYFNLYTKELQEKRTKVKPGLLPPFYADMPKTLDEIMASEMRYLEAYEKNPIKTDLKYLMKTFRNIFLKGARSK